MAVAAKTLLHVQILIGHLCFTRDQTFSMVDGYYGTVVDGVFVCSTGLSFYGFGSSGPVSLSSLPRGALVTIRVAGKSTCFSLAIASSMLHCGVHEYNANRHVAFHYSSLHGRVNSVYDNRTAALVQYFVSGGGPFTAVLTLCGSDRTVSFSVNGMQQHGVWALPTTDVFYLMLATGAARNENSIAVTDVTVEMANLA